MGGRRVASGTEVTSRKGRAICRESEDELRRFSTPPVFSFKWHRAGRVVEAEITVRSKLGKDPCLFMRLDRKGKDQGFRDPLSVSLLGWKET